MSPDSFVAEFSINHLAKYLPTFVGVVVNNMQASVFLIWVDYVLDRYGARPKTLGAELHGGCIVTATK